MYNKTKSFTVPFLFADDENKIPTEYEVCISINGNEYRYGFKCDGKKILHEYLYKRKLSKYNTVEKMIFERERFITAVYYLLTN